MTDLVEAPGTEPLRLADDEATAALGRRIGIELRAGDVVALQGPIGAGKTTLARAILRACLDDPALEVPSPTFTLAQTYVGPHGPVVHADLYRLAGEGELIELGLDEWRDEAALVVEWPERAPRLLDGPRLDVALSIEEGGSVRHAVLSGHGPIVDRLALTRSLDAMLDGAGWGGAERLPMSGDASTRLYRRLAKVSGETAVLMIAHRRPDGPPVRRGRPYSAIARLAESVHAFVAMDRGLREAGFAAPAILAENLEAGLLLLEDFGHEPVVDADGPIPDRYAEATRCLAALHGRALPTTLPIDEGRGYDIPPFDMDAALIEVELLPDWYMPHVNGWEPSGSARAEFLAAWRETLAPVLAAPPTWMLRDYHSPNLIWRDEERGLDRVGLLDFQDAVLGPPAYDVASLLQDARVDVSPELELRLLGTYAAARRAADPGFDTGVFAGAYAVMAAQRATKILGIFARLDRRDGKPGYLRHIPRIRTYLTRNLAHPSLGRLQRWFGTHLPEIAPAPLPEDAAEPEPQPVVLNAGLVDDAAL